MVDAGPVWMTYLPFTLVLTPLSGRHRRVARTNPSHVNKFCYRVWSLAHPIILPYFSVNFQIKGRT